MSNLDGLKSVVAQINTGRSYPALQLVRSDPETAALISKLVRPVETSSFNLKSKEAQHALNQSQLQAISQSTKKRIRDNEYIVQIFPDIELAVQILVSSILSPKDMVNNELIYKSKEALFPAELTVKLMQIIQSHLDNHYKLKDDLQTMLRDALFTTGSYAIMVLPESSLDDIINNNVKVSNEAFKELFSDSDKTKIVHMGFLGDPYGSSKEGFSFEHYGDRTISSSYESRVRISVEGTDKYIDNLEIVDNYNVLRMPKLIEADNRSRINNLIRKKRSSSRVATEADQISNYDMSTLLYKNSEKDYENMLVIPSVGNAKRKNVGRPLVMHIPSEAIIPVYVPGDETHHVGYFVLVDIDGNPVSTNENIYGTDGLYGLLNNQNQNQSLSSLLLQKAKVNLTDNDRVTQVDNISAIYANIVETNLIERLKRGLYGSSVAISENQDIYRIMLARSLAGKFTRLVYVPSEMMTYIAFKYFSNGVGKSYLDDIKNLMSIRAILLFARVMAMTKSAINVTKVNMTLDEYDPDPIKTIETGIHEVVRMRQQYFPLGINSPSDLVDWIQRASFMFTFDGHPGIPNTKFDFEATNLQHEIPPNDFDEDLRKQTYMAFGLTPEMVDNGFNAEFATTVIQNNLLLSKRVLQAQEIFCQHLTGLVQKIVLSDAAIFDELLEALNDSSGLVQKKLSEEENEEYTKAPEKFMEDMVERFIDVLTVELPRPDMATIETQSEAYDQYMEALDKALDVYISTEFLTDVNIGDAAQHIDTIKSVVKAAVARQWMAENNYMPELNDLITSDEDGEPVFDLFDVTKTHAQGLVRSLIKFIKAMKPIKEAGNADLNDLNASEAGEFGGETGNDTEADSSSSSGLDGLDDFNLDFTETEETEIEPETDETPKAEESEIQPETPESGEEGQAQ